MTGFQILWGQFRKTLEIGIIRTQYNKDSISISLRYQAHQKKLAQYIKDHYLFAFKLVKERKSNPNRRTFVYKEMPLVSLNSIPRQ